MLFLSQNSHMKLTKFMNKLLIVLTILVLSSCVSPKKITYFQNDAIDQEKITNLYKTVFKPDDLLQIIVTAEDSEASAPFNVAAVTLSSANNAIGVPAHQPYLVDNNGEIDFPVLGKLKVAGLTRQELLQMLESKLTPKYVKNVAINILITNFRITVTGDVNRPGSFIIPNERISILEAIGMAGDLAVSGKRDNVMVLREEGGDKKEYRLDLRSKNIYTSPAYYLQQNDVVYVEHNRARIQSASSNALTGLYISVTSLIITVVTILTR